MIPPSYILQSSETEEQQSERSPAFTTTCHRPDECAICNIYADHFDVASLLARLEPSDPYTQGLQQGIALRTHENDSLVSHYRSRLATSHLKLQSFQSESTARQIEIQTLQTQATRQAMEIELLKRELAMERDRIMALETTYDELQIELADERRNNRNNRTEPDADLHAQDTEVEDWVWDWDDDWEKYESRDPDESDFPTLNRIISSTSTPPINEINDDTLRDHAQVASTSSSPTDEDWGWVYDVPGIDTSAGFYWEDYQESLSSEDINLSSLPFLKKQTTGSPYLIQDPSTSTWEQKAPALVLGDNNNRSGSRASPNSALGSPTRTSEYPLPSHPESSFPQRSRGDTRLPPFHELTLTQIIDLVTVASSITITTSRETSIASTHTPESALTLIRALIQQSERTPKRKRSEAQTWLLANWRRPSLSAKPRLGPKTSETPVILLKAPTHPILDLPNIPEIYVDASETGVGFYFPLSQHAPSGPNASQWLAYRWSEGGHPSIVLGNSGKIVITWAELIAVEMGVHILRAFGYGIDNDVRTSGTHVNAVGDDFLVTKQHEPYSINRGNYDSGHTEEIRGVPVRKTRILVRSDNLGVVIALSSLSSSKDDEPSVRSARLWPHTHSLNTTAKRILHTCALYNMELKIQWVPSKQNLADGPSRASWGGTWNPRLGKGISVGTGSSTKGKEKAEIREEMLDWDILRKMTAMERVPDHLTGCLEPVGSGTQ